MAVPLSVGLQSQLPVEVKGCTKFGMRAPRRRFIDESNWGCFGGWICWGFGVNLLVGFLGWISWVDFSLEFRFWPFSRSPSTKPHCTGRLVEIGQRTTETAALPWASPGLPV